MNAQTDQQLLRDYAWKHSEAAFAELVRRHIDLVYSAALRMVCDSHQAQDVVQSVFVALAQNAGRLSGHPALSGWLHRTTQNLAANTVRVNVRRQAHEQEVVAMNESQSHKPTDTWENVAPHLDIAIGELSDPDRDALLLRYFERKSAQEMAQTLGISAEAAQKRVNRAVERLRELFAKRGVTVGAGGLVAVVSANAVQAAPTGLAASLSTIAAGTAISTPTIIAATKTIAMTTFQKTLIFAVLAVAVTTPLLIQHRAQTKLCDENSTLREQLKQQTQLAAENERLNGLLEQIAQTNSQSLPKDQLNELLRLRSEVGRLRSEAKVFAQSKVAAGGDRATLLKAQLEQMPEKNIPELQLVEARKWTEDAARGNLDTEDGIRETLAKLRKVGKMKFAIRLGGALNDYIQANNGELPPDLSTLKPYIKYPQDEQPVADSVIQRYELLHSGRSDAVPPGEPLVAEKAPVDDQYDSLFKIGANFYIEQDTGKWSSQPPYTNVWNSTVNRSK